LAVLQSAGRKLGITQQNFMKWNCSPSSPADFEQNAALLKIITDFA
jgi:hypothetical protein